MIRLSVDDLFALGQFLKQMNNASRGTGIDACADGRGSIRMSHWSHSLSLESAPVQRHPDDDEPEITYWLTVGSDL